ncbi:MAG: site-specific DNA-methyltransferase [Chloroflexi bacterium]|nr:site-specific DNA-methyltransferase [Chloroflexota bacterium]
MTDDAPLAGDAVSHQVVIGDSRSMAAVADSSVHLIITSPPYWQLKDYECDGQIGYDQSFEEYIGDLNRVWSECARVLHPGCRACINIGDQFTRAQSYGRYQVLPIHAEVILGMRTAGVDFLGSIIWQKVTTCNPSGGGAVMGSYPYPRNGIVRLDYEYILLFRKRGVAPRPDPAVKAASKLEHREWVEYFSGHWRFPGQKADRHLAAFPAELPHRLIKMYSFVGDTVLDPFLGSGTTAAAAARLGRSSIGYEINPRFAEIIRNQPDLSPHLGPPLAPDPGAEQKPPARAEICRRYPAEAEAAPSNRAESQSRYGSVVRQGDRRSRYAETPRVAAVESAAELRLDDGTVVILAGVRVSGRPEIDRLAVEYLESLVRGKQVVLEECKSDSYVSASRESDTCTSDTFVNDSRRGGLNLSNPEDNSLEHPRQQAFVRLLNRTFLNGKLIRRGLVYFDDRYCGRLQSWLQRYEREAQRDQLGVWKNERV